MGGDMDRRYTAWLLVIVAVLLFSYLSFLDHQLLEQQRQHQLAFGKIYKSGIIEAEVRRGERSYTLANSNPVKKDLYHAEPVISDRVNFETWRVVSRGARTITPDEGQGILTALVGLTFDVRIPEEMISQGAGSLGLQPPEASVRVSYVGGSEILHLGALHLHGDKRYASVSSRGGIFLISEKNIAAVLAPLIDVER
jgi:hypothetical protein